MTNTRDKTKMDLPKDIFLPGMQQANIPENQVTAIYEDRCEAKTN